MSFNDYDKSIGISPTNAIEFDDYRNHLIRSATQINTYKQLPTLSIKVVSPPVTTNLDFQLKNLSTGQKIEISQQEEKSLRASYDYLKGFAGKLYTLPHLLSVPPI